MPLFEKYKVRSYFSGHEHSFQFINRKVNDYKFYQFICGNSGEIRDDKKNETEYNKDDIFYNKSCCYMEVDIIDSKLSISLTDKDKELYKYII